MTHNCSDFCLLRHSESKRRLHIRINCSNEQNLFLGVLLMFVGSNLTRCFLLLGCLSSVRLSNGAFLDLNMNDTKKRNNFAKFYVVLIAELSSLPSSYNCNICLKLKIISTCQVQLQSIMCFGLQCLFLSEFLHVGEDTSIYFTLKTGINTWLLKLSTRLWEILLMVASKQ